MNVLRESISCLVQAMTLFLVIPILILSMTKVSALPHHVLVLYRDRYETHTIQIQS